MIPSKFSIDILTIYLTTNNNHYYNQLHKKILKLTNSDKEISSIMIVAIAYC